MFHAWVLSVKCCVSCLLTEDSTVADFIKLERELISSLKESIEIELEGRSESEVWCFVAPTL